MAQEATPLSVATDDNLRIAFVPSGDANSKAVLDAGTTKDLTYGFTPSGFNRSITQETINDPRLTLKQMLQRAGRVTEELEVQYVFGDSGDVAKVALAEGTTGYIVVRYAVANATAWTATTQKVDVIPIQCGKQRKDAPTENGVWTVTQKLYVTGPVETDVAIVA